MKQQSLTSGTLVKSLFSFKSALIFAALLLGFLSSYSSSLYMSSNTRGLTEDKLKSTMMSLKNHFPSLQPSIIKKLGGAFSRLKMPGEPIVFMLLYNDANKQTTDCLAFYTSLLAKQHIFTDSNHGLWMNGSEWSSYSDADHEELLYNKVYININSIQIIKSQQTILNSYRSLFIIILS